MDHLPDVTAWPTATSTLGDAEGRQWAAFAAAGSTEALCRTWLALQCRSLPGVDAAMLLLARPGGPYTPVAVMPDASQDFGYLKGAAEACLKSGLPLVQRPPHESGAGGLHIAYPFLGLDEQPAGAVVLDLRPRPEEEVQRALRALHWGVGWLEASALRDRMAGERQRVAQAAAALDLVAVANEHDRVESAAIAVVNALAARLGAARVALGLDGGKGARLQALSHTAWFKRGTGLVRGVEAAMDEAMDQRATVRLPAAAGDAVRIQVAHEALGAAWGGAGSIATFPLMTDAGPAGAITVLFDGDAPPDAAAIRLGEAASALLGPIMDAKRRARRMVSGRAADAVRDALAAVAGPRHLGWKLLAGVATSALLAAVLVPTSFRVSAKAVLEGQVQRVAPAPFEGFIATAPIHAGDQVQQGDVLATLDDKDLQLERVRWISERDRLLLKSREAMAKHDRASSAQLEAQLHQTEAQLDLTQQKLARTRIVAPIAGLVVSGDLSQSIGAPVETGKVLFEIAPLDTYRVTVRLDERDIRYVQPGQHGRVLLHGLTGGTVPFTVVRITSVAEADGGHNTFRVEGVLDGPQDALRPGMEGIGKIEIADRSVAWVWTRGLADWVRMTAWSWTP